MAKNKAFDFSMLEVDVEDMITRVSRSFIYAIENKVIPTSFMLTGPPGVGKTFGLLDVAGNIESKTGTKVRTECLLASCIEPTDITGVPYRHDNGIYFDYVPLRWVYEASTECPDKSPMIIFMDDLSVAHPQVQAAFFQVAFERKAGALKFRDNVLVVGAGNRVEDNAAAQEMPTPLCNRFRHLYIKCNADTWLNWATKRADIHPMVVAYIRVNKSALHRFDPNQAERAFPTPRSWEMTSRALYETVIDDPSVFRTVAGIVGHGTASEFNAFLYNAKNCVAPDVIVANPDKAPVPQGKDIDALHATISSLEKHLRDNHKDYKAGLKYSVRDEMLPELGLILATTVADLICNQFSGTAQSEATTCKEFELAFDKYGKHLM